LIYKDINVLTTPLLYYIGVVIFKIIKANFFAFRIYNLIITVLLYIMIYILFRKINISKSYSALYTICTFLFLKSTICYGANYNILALVITIIGIIVIIEKFVNKKQIKYYNCIQGLITFIILFTKQNIGVYYFIALLLVEIFINKKNFMKNILKQIVIIMLLGSMYLIYLLCNNSLYNFIDYTILGMQEFAHKNWFMEDNYLITYIILSLYIIIWIAKYNQKEKNNIIIILFIYSLVYLLIAIPIVEKFHTLIAGAVLVITFIYCIHISFVADLKIKIRNILIFIIVILIMRSTYLMYKWRMNSIEDTKSVYFGAVYLQEQKEAINKVIEYIKKSQEKVVVLSPEAGIYNMYLGIDNGILDLPCQGNVGKNGAEKIINILSNLEQTKILIMEPKEYWQEYDEVRKYVKDNFEIVDEIQMQKSKYIVYYKK